MVGGFLRFHRFYSVMDVRIERLPHRSNRLEAKFLKGVAQALVDQIHALRVFPVRTLYLESVLEIVEDRKH